MHNQQQVSDDGGGVHVQQVIPDVVWTVTPLLSPPECQQLISQATAAGIQVHDLAAGDPRHRNCRSHYFRDETLSQRIWQRLQPHVPATVNLDRQHPPPAGFQAESIRDLCGHWRVGGVNPQFTLLYYTPGGHFGPHRDGYKVLSDHRRSLLTVCIYLTARPRHMGGATQFLQDDLDLPAPDKTTGRIEAPPGTVLASVSGDVEGQSVIFWHDVLHQGQALTVVTPKANKEEEEDDEDETTLAAPPPKWVLLTQVLYDRDPESALQWTEDERLARAFLAQAEVAEREGRVAEAIRLYNKAYRLDPSLE